MVRRLRLISGLILFTFVSTHLVNHALGLISLEAMEVGRKIFLAAWRNWPATIVLYGAALTHMGLAFWAVYQRRRLAMPPWEWAQLLLGLSIPPVLILHVLGTRFAHEVLGVEDSYTAVQLVFWVFDPWIGARQVAVTVVAWVHGCIGLHFWLRLKPWYERSLPITYAAAIVLPLLGLLGVAVAGMEVQALAADAGWLAAAEARINAPDQAGNDLIYGLYWGGIAVFVLLLLSTLGARLLRRAIEQRRGVVQVTYPDGRRRPVERGATILETSRAAGIPHAAVCGGRGRCSTCRVRVGAGFDHLPTPSDDELRVLARVGAAPNVRLACQTRPTADVEVTPLLPPAATPRSARSRAGYLQGEEREIAILFADLRGFTSLSEKKLPYDVVFVLNQYFRAMGLAVEEAGGRLDKFIGDGVMALFGIRRGLEDGSRRALAAAYRMSERLAEINVSLRDELPAPLRIGIGIHAGPVIVGEMGYGPAVSVTAIGDAVNTASRLESLTKELEVQLVVSEPVVRAAAADLSRFPSRDIGIRGRDAALKIFAVKDARALPLSPDSAVVNAASSAIGTP